MRTNNFRRMYQVRLELRKIKNESFLTMEEQYRLIRREEKEQQTEMRFRFPNYWDELQNVMRLTNRFTHRAV